MTTNWTPAVPQLREILQQYQAGERGLPDLHELKEIADAIDRRRQSECDAICKLIDLREAYNDLQRRFTAVVTGEHDEQRDTIRDQFERDCV